MEIESQMVGLKRIQTSYTGNMTYPSSYSTFSTKNSNIFIIYEHSTYTVQIREEEEES
jgi:hypothetical protein